MNVRTFQLLSSTNKSTSFSSAEVDCQRDSGYSVGINITNPTSLQCTLALHSSVGKDKWALIPESVITVKAADLVNYNVSECYYAKFKVVVSVAAGDADFEINITTKSN